VRKTYRYRLYPTRAQQEALETLLETHRHLYNRALAERKDAWAQDQRTVRYGEQSAHLKEDRTSNPYLAQTSFSSCQATLRRLDRAFAAFFRRLKAGETPGYPRFRGRGRFDSVEFPRYGDGCRLNKGRAEFQHIGAVKLKMHRPLEGRVKTTTVRREADGWYVIFSCDLGDVQPEPAHGPATGIDLGLKAFLVMADGAQVAPPQHYRKAQQALRRAQRTVARRKQGSNRRRKAVKRVARAHQHVANQRKDFHHKTAVGLVRSYGLIAHEDLNVRGLTRTRLAKSIHDAGWAAFLAILAYKAACAGVQVLAVDPRDTTHVCSGCGALPATPKTLSDRVHVCSCGLTLDRYVNAARNILRKAARTGPSGANVAGLPACVA
jgi:putative transposase